MGFDEILEVVYQIQGLADGAHPDASRKERLDEIYALACELMRSTGYQPRD